MSTMIGDDMCLELPDGIGDQLIAQVAGSSMSEYRDKVCRQSDILYAWAARRADARDVLRFAAETLRPDLYKAAIRSLDDLDDADFYRYADSVRS